MIIQEKVHLGAPFAKAGEDIQNGDKVEILDEGKAIQSTYQNPDGTFKQQIVFKVKTRNGEKIVRLNQTTQNGLATALGNDTQKWVGKTVTASVENSVVSGKRVKIIYLIPDGFKLGEDSGGYVVIVPEKGAVKVGGADGVDYPTEQISPEDIPF